MSVLVKPGIGKSVSGFVRSCSENLADQFTCKFYSCLPSWSNWVWPSLGKIYGPLHGFFFLFGGGEGNIPILGNEAPLSSSGSLLLLVISKWKKMDGKISLSPCLHGHWGFSYTKSVICRLISLFISDSFQLTLVKIRDNSLWIVISITHLMREKSVGPYFQRHSSFQKFKHLVQKLACQVGLMT